MVTHSCSQPSCEETVQTFELTVFCIFMLGVSEGEVRVGSAGETGAPAGFGVAPAPESDGVLGGNDAVRFCVSV